MRRRELITLLGGAAVAAVGSCAAAGNARDRLPRKHIVIV